MRALKCLGITYYCLYGVLGLLQVRCDEWPTMWLCVGPHDLRHTSLGPRKWPLERWQITRQQVRAPTVLCGQSRWSTFSCLLFIPGCRDRAMATNVRTGHRMLHGAVVMKVICSQGVFHRRPEVLLKPTPPLASQCRFCCESCVIQAVSKVTTERLSAYIRWANTVLGIEGTLVTELWPMKLVFTRFLTL